MEWSAKVLDDRYVFSESGTYFAPPDGTIQDHRDFIKALPLIEAPGAGGCCWCARNLLLIVPNLPLTHYMSVCLSCPVTECFALHENANITFATTEMYSLFGSMLSLMPKGGGGGGGGTSDELIQGIAEGMLARLPKKNDFYTFGLPWLVEDVAEIYPTNYEESMNTVLTQELLRYNAVISNVRTTLQ